MQKNPTSNIFSPHGINHSHLSMGPELASSGFCQTQRLCEDLMDFFQKLCIQESTMGRLIGGEFLLLRPMGVDAVANRHLEHQMGH